MERRAYSVFFLLSSYISLVNRRFFILLVIFATLLIAQSIAKLWDKNIRTKEASIAALFIRPRVTAALLILLTLLNLSSVSKSYDNAGPILTPKKGHPISAVNFLKQNHLGPNLALPFRWGEYAIWHLHPSYLVLMDGRYETVYNNKQIDSAIQAYHQGDITKFLGREKPDAVLVQAKQKMDIALGNSELWKQIYTDDVASIYLKHSSVRDSEFNNSTTTVELLFP